MVAQWAEMVVVVVPHMARNDAGKDDPSSSGTAFVDVVNVNSVVAYWDDNKEEDEVAAWTWASFAAVAAVVLDLGVVDDYSVVAVVDYVAPPLLQVAFHAFFA
jgi:hypothetical protein